MGGTSDGCARALIERSVIAERGLGPKHPDVVALDAQIASCPQPIRVTSTLCQILRRRVRELEARGLGPKHADVRAATARATSCEATRKTQPPPIGDAQITLKDAVGGGFTDLDPGLRDLQAKLTDCAPLAVDGVTQSASIDITIVVDRAAVREATVAPAWDGVGLSSVDQKVLTCARERASHVSIRAGRKSKLVLGARLRSGVD